MGHVKHAEGLATFGWSVSNQWTLGGLELLPNHRSGTMWQPSGGRQSEMLSGKAGKMAGITDMYTSPQSFFPLLFPLFPLTVSMTAPECTNLWVREV